MIRADSLLRPILKNLGIEDGSRLAQIKQNWQKIISRPLSSHMSPSKLSGSELLLNVDSPIWLQQLGYYKREITEKLNAYGVRNVRFRLGKISQDKQHESHEEKIAELSSEETLFIAELISKLSDETIKDALKNAVEKSLRAAKRHTK